MANISTGGKSNLCGYHDGNNKEDKDKGLNKSTSSYKDGESKKLAKKEDLELG